MPIPKKFIIEGLDRLGKDTLIQGIQHRCGYHLVLHYGKPVELECYLRDDAATAKQRYQAESFRSMFELLGCSPTINIICNRAHIGECVYAPIYRGYSGDYVFDLERRVEVAKIPSMRLLLLTEDFAVSRHFVDDGQSLGSAERRREEQDLFLAAFERSSISDKRLVCVTDPKTGGFRGKEQVLAEALG